MANLKANELLGRWLEENGLTQADLAQRIGRSPDIVSRLVRGERRPDIDTAAAVERVTKIPAAAWARPIGPQRKTAA